MPKKPEYPLGKEKIGYMCETDYSWEMEVEMGDPDGKETYPMIYPSVEEIQRHRSCVRQEQSNHYPCGIIKVKIVPVEEITKGKI